MTKFSRRDVIVSAATAGAVLGLPGSLAFIGGASAQSMPEAGKGFFKTKVGDAELITLYDGAWNRQHDPAFIKNATVDDVKAALRAAGMKDEGVTIPFTVTVVRIGGRTIMFDSGTGGQVAPTAGQLSANMTAAGIDPAKIDMIVVTHFHPDHIFGMMAKDTNAAVFPNAQIVVPEAEIKWWLDPATLAKLPEARHGLVKRIGATLGVWKNVTRIADGGEVAPGIKAAAAYGHTPGHTVYEITSGGKQLIVMGDTANIPALFVRNPGWHVSFDADAAAAEAARRKLFDKAIADKATITGYHFGFPGAGTIAKDGNSYAYVPASA